MSRKRYINTTMATDKRLNQLGISGGDFAVMLYTWMIPHASDHADLNGDVEEFMATVIPMRRDKTTEDVVEALSAMCALGLIEWDGVTIRFPLETFYKHQPYIRGDRRSPDYDPDDDGARSTEITQVNKDVRRSAQSGDDPRTSAQNSASFKSSFKSSSSLTPSGGAGGDTTCTPPRLAIVGEPEKAPQQRTRREKPVFKPLTPEQREAIVQENSDIPHIQTVIAEALDHDQARKRSDMNLYVRGWVRRERERMRSSPVGKQQLRKSAVVFDPRNDPMYDDGAWLTERRHA